MACKKRVNGVITAGIELNHGYPLYLIVKDTLRYLQVMPMKNGRSETKLAL